MATGTAIDAGGDGTDGVGTGATIEGVETWVVMVLPNLRNA